MTGGERDSLDGYQSMVTDVWVADVDADGALSPWKLTQPAFFRGYFEGSGRLLLNAVLLGPGLGTSAPLPW